MNQCGATGVAAAVLLTVSSDRVRLSAGVPPTIHSARGKRGQVHSGSGDPCTMEPSTRGGLIYGVGFGFQAFRMT